MIKQEKMKTVLYRSILLLVTIITTVSCEENEITIFDATNGRSIAGFNGIEEPKIVFNPTENTESIITIGVSTISDQARNVNITLSDDSTLDSSYFTISNLNPTIPAGSFTTDITITTIANEELPGGSDNIVLILESIEGAEILENSVSTLTIGLDVKCPTVEIATLAGNYSITESGFANFFGETDFTREVVLGPGENQVTIKDGAYITEQSEDLIITINPDTGTITAVDETKIASQVSFGPNTYAFLPGGRVLTCAGIIEVNLDFGGSVSGNPFSFNLIKM